ncbi:MAG: SBBP repeat-containing protein [Anaerolineales bacterium]|nr:SBBP repeat-containing protein [Anaerolineales bacterium]
MLIAVNSNGEIYTTGIFLGTTDFDPGPDTLNLILILLATDIYILKLNSDGSFVWAKAWSGTDGDWVRDITLDTDGNIYTTGYFRDVVDFDPSANTFTLTSNGYSDIFISKLGNDGRFIFAKNLGGIYADEGFGIRVYSKAIFLQQVYFHIMLILTRYRYV